jgi:hypothetical protein
VVSPVLFGVAMDLDVSVEVDDETTVSDRDAAFVCPAGSVHGGMWVRSGP